MWIYVLWSLKQSNMLRVNTLRPRQNGRHFADAIFKSIFLNENVWISIKISLKFVPKCPINNIPALVQIMAWRWPGDKSLSEPMMVSLPMNICVTPPQWVKNKFYIDNIFIYHECFTHACISIFYILPLLAHSWTLMTNYYETHFSIRYLSSWMPTFLNEHGHHWYRLNSWFPQILRDQN